MGVGSRGGEGGVTYPESADQRVHPEGGSNGLAFSEFQAGLGFIAIWLKSLGTGVTHSSGADLLLLPA